MLGVEGAGLAGQLVQCDTLALDVEGQLEAVVQRALVLHAFAYPVIAEDVHHFLLQHASSNRRLNLFLGRGLEHDQFDSLQVQKVGKQQTGWTNATDGNVCTQPRCG